MGIKRLFRVLLVVGPGLCTPSATLAQAVLPLCSYACKGHCGQVVPCITEKGTPTSSNCGPCGGPAQQPWESLLSTSADCANHVGRALSLHPDNPHYFQATYRIGGSSVSEPVLIASHMNIVPTSTEVSYTGTIDQMSANNLRYGRVWHLLPFAANPDTVYWPWARQTGVPADACYDSSKRRWNLLPTSGRIVENANYWPRMRGTVPPGPEPGALPYASERCITSEIMLFDKSGMLQGAWRFNPWAEGNNYPGFALPGCNGPGGGVPNFYNSALPGLRAAQEAYVRTMIDETLSKNVIYEIENEHNRNDGGVWARYWGIFIKDYIDTIDPAHANPRLVSYSSLGADLNSALIDQTNQIHVINKHFAPPDEDNFPGVLNVMSDYIRGSWGNGSQDYGKAINIDEFGNGLGSDHTPAGNCGSPSQLAYDSLRLRQMAWVIVASGGHFHIEDVHDCFRWTYAQPIVDNIRSFVMASAWNFVGSKPSFERERRPTA